MPKINRYVDIDTVERESKKDYIDRHSPFVHCAEQAKKGEKFAVTVKVGNEYSHPDDFDHYIANISLYNGETLIARADFVAGALGGQGAKGQLEVTFNIVPTTSKLSLTAHAYCTKHGLWESDPVSVEAAE
ncbi:MAG: class II SORL domain-containing protein [Campylobacteraceae bacterium]|jgi:superoxide reductase|nr:class II SORL domain-containing protein [Campylobacteraceae bacterium]